MNILWFIDKIKPMAKNIFFKIQRGIRKVFAKILRFKSRISWGFAAGFAGGIILFSISLYMGLYLYSKKHNSSISDTVKHLLSFNIETTDYSKEFGEEYFIEIGEPKKDIFGDFIVTFVLSDKLYEECKIGFCKVIPEVKKAEGSRLDAEEESKIAGPTILLNQEFEREGEIKYLNVVVGEDFILEEVDYRIKVRVFGEKGVVLGEVVANR